MKHIKLYITGILLMLGVIAFNTIDYNVYAEGVNENENYELFVEQIQEVSVLDEETINTYDEYVSIVDGQYVFTYDGIVNEDVEFILQNIESINTLVQEGAAYIDENDVILYEEDELAAQFGVSNVKWHWYGVNFKMDREMMITVAIAALAVRAVGGGVKSLVSKGKGTSSGLLNTVKNFIKTVVKSPATYETMGVRKLNQTVIMLDEKTGEITGVVEGLITAGLATYVTVQTAIACSTAGVGAIIMQVFNYVLGLFMPSVVDSILMVIGGAFGIYTVCNAQIRWFKGFGGYYSYA